MYRNTRGLARDVAARKAITREAHGAVLELHRDGVPQQNAHWHYDLRRGRLCIYGGLLRFLDACIDAGHPEIAQKVVSLLHWYVVDRTMPTNSAAVRQAA